MVAQATPSSTAATQAHQAHRVPIRHRPGRTVAVFEKWVPLFESTANRWRRGGRRMQSPLSLFERSRNRSLDESRMGKSIDCATPQSALSLFENLTNASIKSEPEYYTRMQ
jgi:hypothetical protein